MPKLFSDIVNSVGLQPKTIINSLDADLNKKEIEGIAESLGKSGSVFM